MAGAPLEVKRDRAHRAWRSVNTIKKASDRIIGVGPFGVGLDGLLTWVPGVGLVYSSAVSVYVFAQALRTGASLGTLARMAAYLAFDTGSNAVPMVGSAVDFLFPGHLMAAKALQKDIETRHGLPPEETAKITAKSDKAAAKAEMKAQKKAGRKARR